MAYDANNAPNKPSLNDEKDESKEDEKNDVVEHIHVSPELAKEIMIMLARSPQSSQVEYFINVYWDKYCNEHKDDIIGIFDDFDKTDKFRSGIDIQTV